jgi:hypothetical protein
MRALSCNSVILAGVYRLTDSSGRIRSSTIDTWQPFGYLSFATLESPFPQSTG